MFGTLYKSPHQIRKAGVFSYIGVCREFRKYLRGALQNSIHAHIYDLMEDDVGPHITVSRLIANELKDGDRIEFKFYPRIYINNQNDKRTVGIKVRFIQQSFQDLFKFEPSYRNRAHLTIGATNIKGDKEIAEINANIWLAKNIQYRFCKCDDCLNPFYGVEPKLGRLNKRSKRKVPSGN